MFIFLLAGHEVEYFPCFLLCCLNTAIQTTSHTLCFSFALLALYPDEQERLYEQIKSITSSLDGTPVGARVLTSYRLLTSP